jgi:hypothetical protein
LAIAVVRNAVKCIGIHFVGMKLFKTSALGIVKNVVSAEIGESGIVTLAIGVHTACHYLVKAVDVVKEGFYKKKYLFFRDKSYLFVYGVDQKLLILERLRQ